MAMTDEARRSLFTRLVEVLGDTDAVTLIDQLPPAGHDIVTRQYLDERLDGLATELRVEMAELRGELRAELRGEMAELRGEMAGLRGEMAGLRGELKSHTLRTILVVNIPSIIGAVALAFAAARL
jgi:hypothetical protein